MVEDSSFRAKQGALIHLGGAYIYKYGMVRFFYTQICIVMSSGIVYELRVTVKFRLIARDIFFSTLIHTVTSLTLATTLPLIPRGATQKLPKRHDNNTGQAIELLPFESTIN